MKIRSSRALVLLALVLAVLAIGAYLALEHLRPRGWHRVPLDILPGRVETAEGDLVAEGAPARVLHFLGTGLPDLNFPDRPNFRFGSRLWGVETIADQRLVWDVPLGRRPALSFRPLTLSAPGCVLRYRAAVRHDGEETPVVDEAIEIPEDPEIDGYFAPALVEVSLERWARERVEIVLWAETEGGDCGERPIAWGAPAVDGVGPLPPVPGSKDRPNVLLVGLDTLRADHLGAYGRTPSPTPALDRWAAESDLFEEAYSAFNVTNPSFTSILTGLWGKNHGVYDLQTPLPEEQTTIAERFAEAGWRTFAVLAAGHLGPERSGLGQGFDAVDVAAGQYAAESAVDLALRWISNLGHAPEPEAPFFLFLHLFDVHTPHTPPRPFARGFGIDALSGMAPVTEWSPRRELGTPHFVDKVLGGQEDLYFDELAYLDHQLDRLYDFLASRDLLETTIVAFVADHGENFGEQGIEFRHAGLWDATLHVPLLVRPPAPPGRDGRRLAGLVQSIDLAPTLLGLAGLEPLDAIDGRDLYELTENGRGRRAVFAEESGNVARAVRTRDHLLMITDEEHPQVQGDLLFDIRAGSGVDAENLAGRGLPVEAELRDLLARWLRDRRARPDAEAVELSEEELQRLRALGYVDN